jgi:hypothetical protein
MKRYLVFAGDTYYPSGGWNDFQRSFDKLEEAVKAMEYYRDIGDIYEDNSGHDKKDWGHVVDTQSMTIVESFPPDYKPWS